MTDTVEQAKDVAEQAADGPGEKKHEHLFTRLAHAGEDVLDRLSALSGAQRILDTANGLRDRVDDLQARVRKLDPLERRVTELERRLDAIAPLPPSEPDVPGEDASKRSAAKTPKASPVAGSSGAAGGQPDT